MAMTLVSTVQVPSGGAASIEFTGIPATGKDLLVLGSLRASSWGENLGLELNGSSANFTQRGLQGNGTTVNSYTSPSNWIGVVNGTGRADNVFNSLQVYVSNYAVSQNKSISAENAYEINDTTGYLTMHAVSWANTAAITSLKITAQAATWLQYTTLSLYIIS